ncbi:hypothetical protein KAR91_86025 [Candidatus Pacearchaeota archaeon]|nr:hypothetical protein [Candidatus Pacearchaeota archaeon]
MLAKVVRLFLRILRLLFVPHVAMMLLMNVTYIPSQYVTALHVKNILHLALRMSRAVELIKGLIILTKKYFRFFGFFRYPDRSPLLLDTILTQYFAHLNGCGYHMSFEISFCPAFAFRISF